MHRCFPLPPAIIHPSQHPKFVCIQNLIMENYMPLESSLHFKSWQHTKITRNVTCCQSNKLVSFYFESQHLTSLYNCNFFSNKCINVNHCKKAIYHRYSIITISRYAKLHLHHLPLVQISLQSVKTLHPRYCC